MNAQLAVAGMDGIPKGVKLFGRLTWFSLNEQGAHASKFQRQWAAEGLDPNLLPPMQKDVNRFQNACRSVETKRASKSDPSRTVEIAVNVVKEDAGECVYQINKMIRDKANRVVELPKAMRVVFDKATSDIHFEPLDPKTYSELANLEARIQKHYEENAKRIPSQKVRSILREYLLKVLNGVHVGGGSAIYFVPELGASTIEQLQRVLDASMENAHLYQLPVMDMTDARGMVKEQFEEATVGEANAFLAEIMTYVRQNKLPRKDKLQNFIVQRRELGRRIKEYRTMLSDNLDQVSASLELLDDEFENLVAMAA
jgi:hypothetical protein